MRPVQKAEGFALVVTLAILVAICVLIVAYVTTMRTERVAAHNDSERRLAQGLAQSTLNRLLADNIGAFEPFKVNTTSKLPTPETNDIYNAENPPKGLFKIEPQADISTVNHLVRLSRAKSNGENAYTPQDWAYLRLKDYGTVFLPKDATGVATTPQWIDYYPTLADGTRSTTATGQIAYAIWEEAGKFDINMAGSDTTINGLAPHSLKIEDFASGGSSAIANSLIAYLDSAGGRDRSNFSLRSITNNTGDDRRVFSIEELLKANLVAPAAAIDLTTFSRDFDVRPEWDGSRDAATAKDFLRSYVNNPDIYRLMAGAAGSSGPGLVMATLDESVLRTTLANKGFPTTDSWMQIMRLLASLRLALPPYNSTSAPSAFNSNAATPISPNIWYNEDIWGIALNIAQASAPVSDEPLIAQDRSGPLALNEQPNTRYGTRLSPYITEIAIKVEYAAAGTVNVTQYVELWNPYPVDLSTQTYIYGESAGDVWPKVQGGLENRTQFRKVEAGPQAGQFKTFVFTTKNNLVLNSQAAQGLGAENGEYGLRLRIAPYLTQSNYYTQAGTSGKPWEYRSTGGPHYSGSTWPSYMLMMWIPAANIPKAATDPAVWYSFQIDDPRMSAVTRFDSAWRQAWGAPGQGSKVTGNWKYSWQGYFNQHSLAGITDGPKQVSGLGDGYNQNFGENWPASWPKNSIGLNRALATYSLPGRPLRNAGEIGNVFAFRPWRTLSFSKSIAPGDTALPEGATYINWPTTLLDYLTTVGTTSESQNLNYRVPGNAPTAGFVEENLAKRSQDFRWLFESVTGAGEPAGNLRPIRGRINLNTANEDTLTALLKAPYRVVNSLGLQNWSGLGASSVGSGPVQDLEIKISDTDARDIAKALIKVREERPLRSLADLAELYDETSVKNLYTQYPDTVMDAVMGRLAQFGTIRQQIYTIDIMARTLNPKAKEKGRNIVTAEVRMLARVYFDTFSRQAFVESVEYR